MVTARWFIGAARWRLPCICLSAGEYHCLILFTVLRLGGIPIVLRLLKLRLRLFDFLVNITALVPRVILRLFRFLFATRLMQLIYWRLLLCSLRARALNRRWYGNRLRLRSLSGPSSARSTWERRPLNALRRLLFILDFLLKRIHLILNFRRKLLEKAGALSRILDLRQHLLQ